MAFDPQTLIRSLDRAIAQQNRAEKGGRLQQRSLMMSSNASISAQIALPTVLCSRTDFIHQASTAKIAGTANFKNSPIFFPI
ncbi:hypothetical protein [Pseudomonas syringae]|uniref:hypothetical protein n=1 Tax=Pseudomonas syringae TaxID=317 RepID=UPI0013656B3A|nr:hypothetical protein [Pseudomonas syringae]